MKYSVFIKWVEEHTPADACEDDFKDYLAMVGAQILDAASKNTGKSIDELIDFHFSKDGHLSQ
jgi:hypothetical protein